MKGIANRRTGRVRGARAGLPSRYPSLVYALSLNTSLLALGAAAPAPHEHPGVALPGRAVERAARAMAMAEWHAAVAERRAERDHARLERARIERERMAAAATIAATLLVATRAQHERRRRERQPAPRCPLCRYWHPVHLTCVAATQARDREYAAC